MNEKNIKGGVFNYVFKFICFSLPYYSNIGVIIAAGIINKHLFLVKSNIVKYPRQKIKHSLPLLVAPDVNLITQYLNHRGKKTPVKEVTTLFEKCFNLK